MSDHRELEVDLTEEALAVLTFEEYGPQPAIHDVRHTALTKHRGGNGWFAEVYRLAEGEVEPLAEEAPLTLRQISASRAESGRINAFHIHPKRGQNEIWTVVDGELLVWLVDCRRHSPTAGVRQRHFLSGEAPARLFIPAGVAHGYRAGTDGALLVYGSDRDFDPADPDEGRLPWDHFGTEIWDEDRG